MNIKMLDGGEPMGCWLRRLNQIYTGVRLTDAVVANVICWGHNPGGFDPVIHQHNHYEICYIGGEGTGRFRAGDEEQDIGPGDVLVARPGVPHQIQASTDQGVTIYWVAFTIATLTGNSFCDVLKTFDSSTTSVAPDNDGRIASLWELLRSTASNGAIETVDHIAAALILAKAELLRTNVGALTPTLPDSSGENSHIDIAIRYLHDNLSLRLTASDVARHIGISVRHLTRVFRSHTGESFYQYLISLRIERACMLLRNTPPLSVQEIGERVGYPDVHHFSRIFRARVGVSPAKYRNSWSLDNPPQVQNG